MDKADLIADQLDQTTISSSSSSRGNKRSGGRGGRGGGRPGGGRAVDLSRALSRLLRHQASNAGIELDKEGYAPLDKVLAWGPVKSLKPTFEEIVSAVKDSDKQRFALKPLQEGGDETSSTDPKDWLIRANQGHSIKLESEGLLKPLAIDPDVSKGELPIPETVVHGTFFAFWPLIKESGGLKRMGRNHVHFSTGLPDGEGVISGMRKDAELLVYVDVARAIGEGKMKFWMSENGVVLTEGDGEGVVGVEYFREVVGRDGGLVGVIWQDGRAVEGGELPEGLKIRQPHGKGGGRGGRGGRGRGRGRGQ
ncbi:putative tRNA 2'-phosphotransferase 1 [Cercophora samala]|uniref:2'-phosphotransferase n=1 Tax=Cercophora samala TaxID=330535 RepID=A0AA40DEI8_9PEZI|nr:putative tRNA 2'-phosphotransferase 1 [Cercophora samala]